MDTIFTNSKNSKTTDLDRLLLNLIDKIDLRRKGQCFFYQITHLLYMEKYKKPYKNNKFKISAPTWNEEFELTDGSYSISDIQDSFE